MNAHVSVRNTAAPTAIAALISAVAAVFALAASSAPAASKVLLKAAPVPSARSGTSSQLVPPS